MWGKPRTKDSWLISGCFDLECLFEGRKHPLFRKPSVGTHGSH